MHCVYRYDEKERRSEKKNKGEKEEETESRKVRDRERAGWSDAPFFVLDDDSKLVT